MKKNPSENTFSQKESKNMNYENKDSLALRPSRNISDKTVMLYKKTKQEKKDDHNQKQKSNYRFLITINVLGSPGPIRFVVNEDDNAAGVIEAALNLYARQERLPILGSHINTFYLYPVNAGFDALKPSDKIGSRGTRKFVLCKKQNNPQMTETETRSSGKGNNGWRKWLQKSLNMNLSH